MTPGDTWLVVTEAPRFLPALLVVPHAGAGTAAYRQLAHNLRDVAQPLTVCLPGREIRRGEPAYTDVKPLVRALVPAIRPHLRGPFVLYGHGMGALIAFETARLLQLVHGRTPAHLVVSGLEAPRTLSRRSRQRYRQPDKQLWRVVRDIGGIPPELADNPAAPELLLPAIRADFQIVDDYTYRVTPPLACPVTSYAGQSDLETPPNLTTGWANETTAGCSNHVLPGGHFFNLDNASGFPQALRQLMATLGAQAVR